MCSAATFRFMCLMTLISVWSLNTGTTFAQAEGRLSPNSVLVRVDGQAITQGDLESRYKARQVPVDLRDKVRDEFIDQLIDDRLIRRFLVSKKIAVDPNELEAQVQQLLGLLSRERQEKLDLSEFGYTEKTLREELSLPLQWRNYVLQTVTEPQIAKYFQQHRSHFDGTRVHVSQIFLKVSTRTPSPELEAARKKLQEVQAAIASREITFADAAKKWSQSPSREQGGDLGFIDFEGKVATAVAEVAFAAKPGEMRIAESPFGVHLILAGDRQPGSLSLEDARDRVIAFLSQELWQKTLQELRKQARIERVVK